MGEFSDWSCGEIIDRMISQSVKAALGNAAKPREYYELSQELDARLVQFNPPDAGRSEPAEVMTSAPVAARQEENEKAAGRETPPADAGH